MEGVGLKKCGVLLCFIVVCEFPNHPLMLERLLFNVLVTTFVSYDLFNREIM